jgi:putative FmdB family regulatory protein
MPIYEYNCQACGESFEKFVRSIQASGQVTCPACGGQQVKKSFSVFGTARSSGPSPAAATACAPSG